MAGHNQEIQVLLFGSLLKIPGRAARPQTRLGLDEPSPLAEILKLIGVPAMRVQLAMVNHRAVPPDHLVKPGDRVSLFPREFGFFPDWKDFRFKN